MRPANVAFVLPHFRAGGAERAVLNWIGALDRARYRPVLMLMKVDGAFLDLLPGDVEPVALGTHRALLAPRAIARSLAAHRIDIAYAATNAMNLALLAAPTRAARIVSEHTPPRAYLAEAKLEAPRRLAMRLLYPRADAIAVPTDAIGDELRALLTPALRIATIANPVIDALAPLPPYRPGTPPRLVAAGRLVPAKGFDVLIDACARIATPFRLDIFGEGPLRAPLADRITAAGLADRIMLRGHSSDLAADLADADLFVLPSRREGFGNVAIEAMAAGVPVLATRGGGPEQLIRDGTSGFLVPSGDEQALAETIAALLAVPDRRAAVRIAGHDIASGYGVASSTRALETLFACVAQRRSGDA